MKKKPCDEENIRKKHLFMGNEKEFKIRHFFFQDIVKEFEYIVNDSQKKIKKLLHFLQN